MNLFEKNHHILLDRAKKLCYNVSKPFKGGSNMSKKRLLLASAILSVATLAASCGGGGGDGTASATTTPPPSTTPPPPSTTPATVDYVAVFQATNGNVYKVEFTTSGSSKTSQILTTSLGNIGTKTAIPLTQFSNKSILIVTDEDASGEADAGDLYYIVTDTSVSKVMDGPIHVARRGVGATAASKYYIEGTNIIREDGVVLTRDAQVVKFVAKTEGSVYRTSANAVVAVAPDGTQTPLNNITSDLSDAITVGNFVIFSDTVNQKVYVVDTSAGKCAGGTCNALFTLDAGETIAGADLAVVGNVLYVAVKDSNGQLNYATVSLATGNVSVSNTNVDAGNGTPDTVITFAFDGQGNLFYVADNEGGIDDDALVMISNNATAINAVKTSAEPNCYNVNSNVGATSYMIQFSGNVVLVDTGNNKACQLYNNNNVIATVNRTGNFNAINTFCTGAAVVGRRSTAVGCLQPGQGFMALRSSGPADLTLAQSAIGFTALYPIPGIGTTVGNNVFARVVNTLYKCNPTDTNLCTALSNITNNNAAGVALAVNRPIDGKIVGTGGNVGNQVVYFDYLNDQRQVLSGVGGFPHFDVFTNKVVGAGGIQSPSSCALNIVQIFSGGSVVSYTPSNTSETALGSCIQSIIGFVK
ncbi:MAG: hypothetical protein QW196_03500 [Sulfolobales archaeon]